MRTEDFFMAISSINLTSHLISFLYMNKSDVPETHSRHLASRAQFKTFCKLNADKKVTFFELHCLSFDYMYFLWKK